MAQSINTFIKSKLNKDLDARLLPNGEYRDAKNVQVSKSEGPNVGSLENVLGNEEILDFDTATGDATKWRCIGYVVSEINNSVFLFLTDFTDPDPLKRTYDATAKNCILKYNSYDDTSAVLIQGSFLNFSRTSPIYGINLLEDLLFWTDNRNQPRKINVSIAESNGVTYYTTEDQISVAKYNPYEPIYFWQSSAGSTATVPYETTMKDVTSKFYPNGGSAFINDAAFGGGTAVVIDNIKGDILIQPLSVENPYAATGATVSYIHPTTGVMTAVAGATVDAYATITKTLTITGGTFPALADNTEIVFNPNTYYDYQFAGDEDYLEDKFVRFSYRFKFDDGEYSIMAPFTQAAFIPKQDGYFMYVKQPGIPEKDDQTDSYRSTIVSFMESKVDEIKLRIPLPFSGNTLASNLKVTEMDLLYKESDGLSVKVIDTVLVADIATEAAATQIYDYTYLSKKPFKTLPSDEIIRVFDKVPVRALAQEVSGNRIIYGNFQNKHTPLTTIDYNVAVGAKDTFDLGTGTATVDGDQNIAANIDFNITGWTPFEAGNDIVVGDIVSITSTGAIVGSVSTITTANTIIKIDAALNLTDTTPLTFNPVGPDSQTVSRIEYPNSSVKQNRNYQVGVVLADRFGRQSSVILSSNDDVSAVGSSSFVGDTIYSAYNNTGVEPEDWPGDSIKVLFNTTLGPSSSNHNTLWPGLYDGDSTTSSYNPLGWYSYKIVVKQSGQEYYNVYLPGIMASYPEDQSLELASTSFAPLINDNINKVPRDLTEVGPDQRQFRSSVQLFGRVENTTTAVTYGTGVRITYPVNFGQTNTQYYPGRATDTVSTVSTLDDLFTYNPADPPRPNYYYQFYALESNPLLAKISTETQIGQIATTNYAIASGLLNAAVVSASNIVLKNVIGTPTPGAFVTGAEVPEGVFVGAYDAAVPDIDIIDIDGAAYDISLPIDTVLSFWPGFTGTGTGLGVIKRPGLQYLAIYETEPVESLLDIYWETTTAGLISDLNSLILNSTQGAANLSSFNTAVWDEGLASGADILNADFTLVDNFGVNIPSADIDTVTLASAFDSNSPAVDRQLVVNGGPYFALAAGAAGYNNIVTTAAYYSNIFYSNSAENRTFTFTINTSTSVDGNVSNNSFSETGGPDNVNPVISGTPVPLDGTTKYTNRTITTVQATCDFVNGADNTTLQWQDLTVALTSVTNSASANVTSSNYFSLTTSQPGTVQRGEIAILDSTMPIDIYDVTIEATDGGISPTAPYHVLIDLRTTVDYAEQIFRCANGDYTCTGYTVVIMSVSSSGTSADKGWYGFIGSLNSDVLGQGGPLVQGGNITLDKTSAFTAAQVAGNYQNDLFFYSQATPNQAGLNVMLGWIAASCDDNIFFTLDNPTDETWCYLYGTGSSAGACGCTQIGCDTPYVLDISGNPVEVI